jgi:hypothetical protein
MGLQQLQGCAGASVPFHTAVLACSSKPRALLAALPALLHSSTVPADSGTAQLAPQTSCEALQPENPHSQKACAAGLSACAEALSQLPAALLLRATLQLLQAGCRFTAIKAARRRPEVLAQVLKELGAALMAQAGDPQHLHSGAQEGWKSPASSCATIAWEQSSKAEFQLGTTKAQAWQEWQVRSARAGTGAFFLVAASQST